MGWGGLVEVEVEWVRVARRGWARAMRPPRGLVVAVHIFDTHPHARARARTNTHTQDPPSAGLRVRHVPEAAAPVHALRH